MILRLSQVEFGLVLVVVVRYVGVRHGDLRVDLFVQQLADGQISPQRMLQIVDRLVARLQTLLELLLGVRSLHLGELRIHLFIGRRQIHLGGALLHNLLVNQRAQHVQSQRIGLFLRKLLLLRRVAKLRLISLIQIRPHNGVAIHGGDHIGAMWSVATRRHQQSGRQNEPGWKRNLAKSVL